MDIQAIRRANLATLVQSRFGGSQNALAIAVDRQASYISRCLSASGKHAKPIGEKFARHIEASLDLPLAPSTLHQVTTHRLEGVFLKPGLRSAHRMYSP